MSKIISILVGLLATTSFAQADVCVSQARSAAKSILRHKHKLERSSNASCRAAVAQGFAGAAAAKSSCEGADLNSVHEIERLYNSVKGKCSAGNSCYNALNEIGLCRDGLKMNDYLRILKLSEADMEDPEGDFEPVELEYEGYQSE